MKKDKEEINGVDYFFISERTHRRELIDRIAIFGVIAFLVIGISIFAGIEFVKKHNDKYKELTQNTEQSQNEGQGESEKDQGESSQNGSENNENQDIDTNGLNGENQRRSRRKSK